MDDKDPPPFGYTFSGDFFSGSPSNAVDNQTSLLSDTESQSLTDFFNNTGYFDPYMPFPETKNVQDDMAWGFVPPASIHAVSTTIPDQSQLHHPFANDRFTIPQHTNHGPLFNTTDDLRAASTLYNHAQMPQAPQAAQRSHSFHALPNANQAPLNNHMNGYSSGTFNGLPMVPTPHGMVNEQIAALLPRHDANGSVDAQLVAEFATSPAHERHEAELREHGIIRQPLKRTYTYGTDSSFNEAGFQVSSKEETEEHVTSRLIAELQHAQPLARPVIVSASGPNLKSPVAFKNPQGDMPSEEDGHSEDITSGGEEGEEKAAKMKRKGKTAVKNSKRKAAPATGGKNRKASVDDRVSKKKRGSVAAQKLQRENLSEEQKRSNHILSEQKRRNLIKRGFDDLAELVPEIRTGGLSKSGVLTEAANFLEFLITSNKQLEELVGDDDDDG
ncbi:unnamed protein product [Periconia digitata]|uniref:BHLH domain-containing protein n=1 Tax=Periconia digitata TaxID=1303443 RepID=A0A9W4U2I4_9PLEO|nr:unnamed protein product [Periconia digitata]